MRRFLLPVFSLAFSIALVANANAGIVTATWNFTSLTPTIGNPQSGFTIGNLGFSNVGGGTNNNSQSTGYVGASGGQNARLNFATGPLNVNTSDFFTFTVSTNAAVTAELNQFDFGLWRSSVGPTNFVLRSSKDGYASNLASWSKSGSSWSYETSAHNFAINSSESVTFRLYGFGATDNTATNGRIDDLKVQVNVSAVPEPGTLSIVSGLIAGFTVLSRRRRQA
jgi:hypothetical protein